MTAQRTILPLSPARLTARHTRGFTLPEMMISIVLMAIVLSMTASAVLALAKGSQSLVNYSEMNTESRFALENLGRHLRSASDVISVSETTFQIKRVNGSGATEEIQYVHNPSTRTFTMNNLSTGETDVLLNDVNSLTLNYYTLRQDPTTAPLEVKHIQLEAELTRDVLTLTNRNYIISARFMLRNRRVSN